MSFESTYHKVFSCRCRRINRKVPSIVEQKTFIKAIKIQITKQTDKKGSKMCST